MAKLVVKLMFDAAVVELDWSLCRAVPGLAGLSIVSGLLPSSSIFLRTSSRPYSLV
jgi:hypothetical protein